MGRAAWTVDDPPEHIRALVEWWVHERKVGEKERDFAEQAGVALQSVRNWTQDPRVRQLLGIALDDSNASPQKVQEVMDMLHRRATQDDDVKAASLYLQTVGKLVPRSRVDVVHHDARQLSQEQLRAELSRAMAMLEGGKAEEVIEVEVLADTG